MEDGRDACNQEERIASLRREAERLSGHQMHAVESELLSAAEREQFWQRVVDCETAPLTTNFQQLVDEGLDLPAPDAMDDACLTSKLWEVIRALARLRVFVSATNHLSDRELYSVLWHRALREEVEIEPIDPASSWHIDLVSDGSDASVDAYLRYYADESARGHWVASFPDCELPPRADPPYDRDRHLPGADGSGAP